MVKGKSTIKVTFTPTDLDNWDTVTESFVVNVDEQDSGEDVNELITALPSKRYSISSNYLYTRYDTNSAVIENSLSFGNGVQHSLSNNRLLVTDSNNNQLELDVLNFSTSQKIVEDTLYIKEDTPVDSFLNLFKTNGVVMSVNNLSDNNVVDGSVLNVLYKEKVLDSYKIKKLSATDYDNLDKFDNVLVNPKTGSHILPVIVILVMSISAFACVSIMGKDTKTE